MQLREGTIPMNRAEAEAYERLLLRVVYSVARRDPGETGPIVAYARDATYEISKHGKVTRTDG